MIDDLVRLVNLGVITVDKIADATIKAEVQAKLSASTTTTTWTTT